jgi:hypothetical protein
MKIYSPVFLFLMPVLAVASNYQGMSEQDMQSMMQDMQKAEACLQKIDQSKLKALEQRSRQFEAELKSLCASGKRDQAEAKALAFSKELMADPTMQQMSECSKLMKGAMQGMMPEPPAINTYKDRSASGGHVCDY